MPSAGGARSYARRDRRKLRLRAMNCSPDDWRRATLCKHFAHGIQAIDFGFTIDIGDHTSALIMGRGTTGMGSLVMSSPYCRQVW